MSRREKRIAFVEHPLTKDEKWDIIDQGYQIIDVRFKPEKLPEGAKVFMKPKKEEKAKK